jgi:hypothetical protein
MDEKEEELGGLTMTTSSFLNTHVRIRLGSCFTPCANDVRMRSRRAVVDEQAGVDLLKRATAGHGVCGSLFRFLSFPWAARSFSGNSMGRELRRLLDSGQASSSTRAAWLTTISERKRCSRFHPPSSELGYAEHE